MSYTYPWTPTHGLSTDQDQKRAALNYLNEAWAEARHDGVDGDCANATDASRAVPARPAMAYLAIMMVSLISKRE